MFYKAVSSHQNLTLQPWQDPSVKQQNSAVVCSFLAALLDPVGNKEGGKGGIEHADLPSSSSYMSQDCTGREFQMTFGAASAPT